LTKKSRSTLASIFVVFVSLFPNLGRRLWQRWYDFLASYDDKEQLRFMNYGYDAGQQIQLAEEDKDFQFQIQLYAHVVNDLNLTDKHLLEVGSGRGGGIDYLSRNHSLKSLTGIDLSDRAIERCKVDYTDQRLEFIQGSADKLTVASNSKDIVINVESSHCYPDVYGFLNEVMRVLVPGGKLAICDIRTPSSMDKLEKAINDCGFSLENKQTITPQVISALEKMSDDRIKIAETMPSFLKKAFTDFAGVKSSAAYEMMKNNKLVYKSFLLAKPEK